MQNILDCMYLKKHGSFEHNATFNPIQDIVVVGVINKCMMRLDFSFSFQISVNSEVILSFQPITSRLFGNICFFAVTTQTVTDIYRSVFFWLSVDPNWPLMQNRVFTADVHGCV